MIRLDKVMGIPLRGGRLLAATMPLILSIGLALAGCQTDSNFGPILVQAEPTSPYAVASNLQTGDRLKVIVYGQDALSGVYEIGPDGTLTMPLIGTIRAAGLDRKQVELALVEAYTRFLKDPRITVADVAYRPIYVLGEVHNPGKYPYTVGLDALTAVTTAGGFTYRASTDSILIRHFDSQDWQQYSLARPLPIQPGDLIRVSERYF